MTCQHLKLHTFYMKIVSISFDILTLTETWLNPDIWVRCDRNRLAIGKSDREGVLVTVDRELKPIDVNTQFNHSSSEQIIVQLPASGVKK